MTLTNRTGMPKRFQSSSAVMCSSYLRTSRHRIRYFYHLIYNFALQVYIFGLLPVSPKNLCDIDMYTDTDWHSNDSSVIKFNVLSFRMVIFFLNLCKRMLFYIKIIYFDKGR